MGNTGFSGFRHILRGSSRWMDGGLVPTTIKSVYSLYEQRVLSPMFWFGGAELSSLPFWRWASKLPPGHPIFGWFFGYCRGPGGQKFILPPLRACFCCFGNRVLPFPVLSKGFGPKLEFYLCVPRAFALWGLLCLGVWRCASACHPYLTTPIYGL